MGRISAIIGIALLICVSPSAAGATTLYVAPPPLGSDSNPGTEDHPFATIQKGIDAASDGDTVIVAEGTYIENIEFNGKNIILRSTDPLDPDVVASTVIDGNQSGSVVTFSGTEDETCVLSGFTIRNGKAQTGGGICGGTWSPQTEATIENNTITQNQATGEFAMGGALAFCHGTIQSNTIRENKAIGYLSKGGGLSWCQGTIRNNTISGNSADDGGAGGLDSCGRDGTIQNNRITGNSAEWGGGVCSCLGTIQNNIISGNSADGMGGGVHSCGRDSTIQNNRITGNSAEWGAGLSWCEGTIQNNTITGNSASHYGGGLWFCDGTIRNNTISGNSAGWHGAGLESCDGTIGNCIMWGNSPAEGAQLLDCSEPSYSCIQDWTGGGEGNISLDPQFVDADGPDNDPATYEDNDYRLSADSPCIDKGKNEDWMADAVDLDGNPRILDGDGDGDPIVDMGAYEYGEAAYHPSDDNQDLIIDDWELLWAIEAWAGNERMNGWPKNLDDYDWALLELIELWAKGTEYDPEAIVYGGP